jgi:hypothetical protein
MSTTTRHGNLATTSLLDGTWPLRPFHPDGFWARSRRTASRCGSRRWHAMVIG